MVHLDADGEGLGQKTTHGYLFLLNLLFRPAIIVISATFAYQFTDVLGKFANGILSQYAADLVSSASNDLIILLLVTVAAFWLVVVVNMKIVGVAASLMHIIPTQIFTWLGAHFGSDVGSGVHAEAGHGFSGGAGAVGSGVGQGARMGSDMGKAGIGAYNQRQAGIKGTAQFDKEADRQAAMQQAVRTRMEAAKDGGGGGGNAGGTVSGHGTPGADGKNF